MSEALKDYCEQEGIECRSAASAVTTRDDVINAEIEQEHKEAWARCEIQILDINTYTKKPVAIKAAQLTKSVWDAIDENCPRKTFEINGQDVQAYKKTDGQKTFLLQTLEGQMEADINDWLIIGIKGEIYACKPDIFEKTYTGPQYSDKENIAGVEFVKLYEEDKGHTAVYAIDKPAINNNAYHEFVIKHEPENATDKVLQIIKLQNGNFAEFGHNGIFTEHLLVIAKDCLERFNTSKYSCRENSIAITKIEEALMWIDKRMAKRVERGVYGTETV